MKKSIVFLGLSFILSANSTNVASVQNVLTNDNCIVFFEDDVTPLCKAISNGDIDLVERILEYGVDLNGVTYRGMTPLMYAARYNKVEIVKMLIEKGANLTITDSNGFNALDHAKSSDSEESKDLIIEALKR